MWIRPDLLSETQTVYTDALGRALVLAQNFEHNCKFVFGTQELGRAYEDGRLPIAEWKAYAKKLQRRSLGLALRAQQQDELISSEEITKLEAALAARNYLAHESGEFGQYVPPMSGKPGGTKKLLAVMNGTLRPEEIQREREKMLEARLNDAVGRLAGAVLALAEADGMVAGWCYVIEEKDTYLPLLAQTYPKVVTDWVLEPLRTAGLINLGP